MIGLAIFASLAVILFFFLLWFRRSRVRSGRVGQSPAELITETMLPRHYLYFPQIRQALSALDEEYLNKVAPHDVARIAHQERRAVARHFLAGLREDFSNLERLARIVAALSPVISSEQETERIILGLKFRFLYGWVWLRLSTGRASLPQIEQLTGLVGRLAKRMEEAMAAVGALSVPGLNSSLNA